MKLIQLQRVRIMTVVAVAVVVIALISDSFAQGFKDADEK